jgi:hypothetical protein
MRRKRGAEVSPPGTVLPGSELLPGYEVVGLLSHGRRIDTYDVHSLERDCRCVVKVVRKASARS